MDERRPIQETYNPQAAICYGCGPHNPHGLHIRTYWDGTLGHCYFQPRAEHTAFPGYVYGGLLASLIDCHSVGTAIAAMYSAEGREPGTEPEITCVTGNLNVTYLKPTPIDGTLRLEARVLELSERKARIACSIYFTQTGEETVRGEVIAVRVPSRLMS